MKRSEYLNIGILAHVDAGKTTLAESMLFLTGAIRRAGRVDHQDAFLDTYELERRRGITIFSKMARLTLGQTQAVLLDTPGHTDFSAEMERTLAVLDAAILVISASDAVTGHDRTLWRLLKQYQVPTVLFINKMDLPGADLQTLLRVCREKLDEHCVDFTDTRSESFLEETALCDEQLLEAFLEGTMPDTAQIRALVADRKIFPCWFGSALKMEGIRPFLEGLETYLSLPEYPDTFGARVYKITRDRSGERLTWMKITGGSLKMKQVLGEEKADQLRLYSADKYTMAREAQAGCILAVTGLQNTRSGQTMGSDAGAFPPVLEPVMRYSLILTADADPHSVYLKAMELEEEIPELHVLWDSRNSRIQMQVMGEVQIEILRQLMLDRWKVDVHFDEGSIVYRETIADTVEGVGHYEPLRHYAEVHLILEPGERGSGLQFDSLLSVDELDLNWQRLILTHLDEKEHIGVLTGSPITDMRISLAAGKAHLKHTEGGDFRQATYRAVRQGLMKAKSVLLEPVLSFRMELPADTLGRAMTDIRNMHGQFDDPQICGEEAVLTGKAPAKGLQNYQQVMHAYTRGNGRLETALAGYEECADAQEVIEKTMYRPQEDQENPCGSVFCAHGAGFVVPWNEVEDYMHLESVLKRGNPAPRAEEKSASRDTEAAAGRYEARADIQDDAQLLKIFEQTYGKIRQERAGWKKQRRVFDGGTLSGAHSRPAEDREQYLLVDGYNIIFAWDELRTLAESTLEGARDALTDILSNYQGYRNMHIILVFDAYRVENGTGSVCRIGNIDVVYTKEAETADQYIEKTTHEIGRKYDVTVATSDAAEQVIIWAQGARRMSARELREEIAQTADEIRENYLNRSGGSPRLFDGLDEALRKKLEQARVGGSGERSTDPA